MPRYGTADLDYAARLATTPPEDDGPVWMVNLMNYRDVADYADGRETTLTGREADDEYTPIGPLTAIGAEIVYAAEVEMTPLGDGTQWDRVGIVKYPTRRSFVEMQQREDFQALHVHKEAGMKQTFVIGCQPMDPQPDELAAESAGWDEVEYPPTPDDGELHVLHVIKWNEGGRETMQGYHEGAAPAATRSGVRFAGWLEAEGTILGDGRTWDEVRFNVFPSMQEFIENVVKDPTRLEAQGTNREPAMADTYTLFCRPTIDRLRESFPT